MEKKDISIIDELMIIQLPEKGENINIRILAPPERLDSDLDSDHGNIFVCRCQELGVKRHSSLKFNSIIYKGMLNEFKKAKDIYVDEELKCMVNCIFTIGSREWFRAPKELWKLDEKTGELIAPRTFCISLRKDLMNR